MFGWLQMGVVNRDIKLENTLLDGGRRALLKICDFGYSKNEKDSLPKSKVGTPGYTGKTRCLPSPSNPHISVGLDMDFFNKMIT